MSVHIKAEISELLQRDELEGTRSGRRGGGGRKCLGIFSDDQCALLRRHRYCCCELSGSSVRELGVSGGGRLTDSGAAVLG